MPLVMRGERSRFKANNKQGDIMSTVQIDCRCNHKFEIELQTVIDNKMHGVECPKCDRYQVLPNSFINTMSLLGSKRSLSI